MAYERTTWECGDVVTAEKLNNIEDGVQEALACCGGGGDAEIFWVDANYNDGFNVNTTFAEIEQAIADGQLVILRSDYGGVTNYHMPTYYYPSRDIRFTQLGATIQYGGGGSPAITQVSCFAVLIDANDVAVVADQILWPVTP